MMASVKKVCAVDLFCGIGGLTHGLRKTGIDVRAGIDNDISCKYAYEKNNGNAEFIHADIREVSSATISKYYEGADIKVLVGCAPCQPFSTHTNKQAKSKKSKNFSLLTEIARLVKDCAPDIVSVENVPGLIREDIYSDFVATLQDLNYRISSHNQVVFCPEYGIPQTRRRLVYLASRIGEISLIPPPFADKKQWSTVADFIQNLSPLENGETSWEDQCHSSPQLTDINLKRIKQSKPGGSWRDWDDDLVLPCHKKSTYLAPYGRMKWDNPAPTITTQFNCYSTGRFGHPTQNRTISLREGALLQTFPKSYKLYDENEPFNRTQIARHIGNAVPVKLAEAIGQSIWRHINE